MRIKTYKITTLALAALLASCSGGGNSAAPNPPPAAGTDPKPAPVAYRLMDGYLAPPEPVSDRDFDGIPDDDDEYPDRPVVQADAFGDSAFVIERAFTRTSSGDLEAAATASHELTIIGRGLDGAAGQPQLLFTGGLRPVVMVPDRLDATTWRVKPPQGASAVFAIIGNKRSNVFPISWLSANAPKLSRLNTAVSTGSVIELDGFELGNVDSASLGGDAIEIVTSSAGKLQLRLPSAPTSNKLLVVRDGLLSNTLELDLRHDIRVALDTSLSLPAGTMITGRHNASLFDVSESESSALTVTGHKPYAFYFSANGEYSRLGTIAWPDQVNVSISSATTLMTDLWVSRLSLPIRSTMDWRDIRAFLESAVRLPEAQAFIIGHQAWLAGDSSWDRYAARQLVMDALAANNRPSSSSTSKSTLQQAAMIAADELDDIVAFTISPTTTAQPDFGDNSTVDQPRADIPGTTYSQFEVAAHAETSFLLDICGYPPNTPVPAGIWPSDLCMQNSTAVFASFAVYQPDKKTFGVPYTAAAADLRRRHIAGPGSTEAALEGAVYLTDNRQGGTNQPTLCRLQTCFVEVLTSGFGNGFKDTGLTPAQKRVVKDLRLKWVFEGMIVPIIADKLGLAQVPACLAGEIYANDKIYPKIEALVAGIREDRATYTVTEAKQLFDDIVGVWLKGILTGALAENGNIVNCVATETTKSAIKDAFIGATKFGELVNDLMFVGGLILTPEKFTFKVQYRAEVGDVLADFLPGNVTPLIDTVNGLYIDAAKTNPRKLSITGTWITDENQSDPTQSYYPNIMFRDSQGNTERFLTDSRHYVETNDVSIRQLDIPLLSLIDNAEIDLNALVPGKIDITLEYIHAIFDGYDGRMLRVPSPVKVLLVNEPKIVGFTPPSVAPGSLITVNGTGLDAFGGTPGIELYRHAGPGDFSCSTADPQLRVAVPPARVLGLPGGKEVSILLPEQLDLNAFYYVCMSSTGGSSAETTASSIPFFSLDVNLPNTGLVTFSDFGRVKDDAIRLSVMGNDGLPISYTDVDGTLVTLVFNIPNPEDGKRVRTVWWDNNILNNSFAKNAQSLMLECMDSGDDTTCTYGIGATNVLLDEVESMPVVNAVSSDAGKFSPGDKVEYTIIY